MPDQRDQPDSDALRSAVQLALWGRPADPRPRPGPRPRGAAAAVEPGLRAATEVVASALAWAEALLEAADRHRSHAQLEAEDQAIAWLDEAELEAIRLRQDAREEAARVVAAGESARRALIEQGRVEAERRVAASDALAEEFLTEADAERDAILARPEELLAEADAERDAILARAEEAAARIRAEAEAALDRSLEEADRERTRVISAAREEIVSLRAEADQALQAEASALLDRARLEADTVRSEAERHALLVRAEATAAFARHVERASAEDPVAAEASAERAGLAGAGREQEVVEGFIGSGLRRPARSENESADAKPRRRLGRLLRMR